MPAASADRGQASPLDRIEPGIKIAAQMAAEPRDQDLRFVQMMGLKHVVLWTDGARSSAEFYASRKAPPFKNLYFALNTAHWAGPAKEK